MSANTGAGAVSRFLNSSPESTNTGALIERLGNLLRESGGRMELAKALEFSGLSRADFINVLSAGQSTGVLQTVEEAGQSWLLLGPMGKSLF
jgi:hypothetical protein